MSSVGEARATEPSAETKAFLGRAPHGLLIGGDWEPAAAGGSFETIDPASERPLAVVAEAAAADV
ncbi:MAG TPA: hypothetical protein VHE08_07015, partial [Solirubrobacterales bacterium]|nr:hypothetical protein [Solirubrobacterales bacterium]